MRTLSAHEIVVEMLRSYSEVCGPGEKGAGSDLSDDRILMLNPLWSQGSYAELYRCLYLMREREANLYWHTAERYIRATTRITQGCSECRQETRPGTRHTHFVDGSKLRPERGPIVQEVWRRGVDLGKVEAGVEWIVREHNGPPYLPQELYSLIAA